VIIGRPLDRGAAFAALAGPMQVSALGSREQRRLEDRAARREARRETKRSTKARRK